MEAIIVYESMFGDGQQIAEKVADGLREKGLDVSSLEVGIAPNEIGAVVDLLVVGAPNHAMSLSRSATRASAAEQAEGELISQGIGVREWLQQLEPGHPETKVAVWDTRGKGPKAITSMDHASGSIRRKLNKLGFGRLLGEENFLVEGMQGPLVDGERERAWAWALELAATLEELERA